jgi:transcriptional regulator GlxA family with amidase domain
VTLDLLLTELADPDFASHAMAEVLIKRCLILLLREQAQNERRNGQLSTLGGDQRLGRAVAEVLVDPSAGHTLATLAQKAGMSRASFADHFKQTYGQTPMNFVKTVRLETAATLLTTSDTPMKVISSAVGYTSRSSFSRAFRDVYGVDPKTYRSPTPDRSTHKKHKVTDRPKRVTE